MARSFVRTSSQYLETNAAPVTAAPFTISVFVWTSESANDKEVLWIGDKDVANHYWGLQVNSAERVRFEVNAGATEVAAQSPSTTFGLSAWHHIAAIERSATDREVYYDGSSVGTNTTSRSPAGADRISIGRDGSSSPAAYMDGLIAEVGIWNIALNTSEIAALAKGFAPPLVRPTSLVFYLPCIVDTDKDLRGGLSLTPSGSPTVGSHARIFYPVSPYAVIVPSAGGTTYDLSVSIGKTHAVADVGNLGINPSLNMGKAHTVADIANLAINPSLNIGKAHAVADGANLGINPSLNMGKTHAVADGANLGMASSFALSILQEIEQLANLAGNVDLSLVAGHGVSATGNLDFSALISLALFPGLTTAGGLAFGEAVTLGTLLENTFAPFISINQAVNLGTALGLNVSSLYTLGTSVTLGHVLSLIISSGATYPTSITLGTSAGMSFTGNLSLSQTLTIGRLLAMLTAEASGTIIIVVDNVRVILHIDQGRIIDFHIEREINLILNAELSRSASLEL